MRLKELKRTVNVSWSPGEVHPVYLAAASAAQQVDASFSSSSQLELYSLNLEEPGLDLELKTSLQTKNKFHKLVWSGAGVLIGGCDNGRLEFYGTERMLSGATDALLTSSDKHSGNISALDVNPYQKNLVASGGGDSEIFIWDLGNTSQPMAPGGKSQPLDHVQGLAWNQQVQHILGSTFANRCVVWDLRKNEPIMKLSDSQSRTRWRSLAWHPSVATQLCIASEDDQTPVVQLWDLRLAASPLVTLEGHHKGVLALSWCRQDPDLLMSGGKDGKVLCWNPNNNKPGGELLCELSCQSQWVFDVAWCPRDPALFVCASFDNQTSVHSLLGGSTPDTSVHNTSTIMDSFGGMASFEALPCVQRAPTDSVTLPTLPRPPRWLRPPVGAKFGFGGKLITFEKCPEDSHRLVHISQVVSEPDIVERASELDTVLGSSLSQDPSATERLAEYCFARAESVPAHERATWLFLRAHFLPSFRNEVLTLLGYKPEEIPSRFRSVGDAPIPIHNESVGLSRGESTETEAELSTDTSSISDAHTLIERKLAHLDIDPPVSNVSIPHGEDTTSLICRALVCGNLEEAVELCLEDKRVADALIIASLGSQELLYKVQKYHLNQSAKDPVALIAGSLLLSKWDTLVQAANPGDWKDVLAALATHCEGEALAHYCEMLGDKLSSNADPSLTEAATLCYLCAMSPEALGAAWSRSRRSGALSLGKLAELALLARRAAQARGTNVQSLDKLESVLTEYAFRLASQGCLHSALNTLEGTTGNELKERLSYALGIARRQSQAAAVAASQQRSRTTSGHSTHTHSRRGHVVAHNDVSHTYSAVPPSYEQPWSNSSVPAPAPYQPSPYQPAAGPPPPPPVASYQPAAGPLPPVVPFLPTVPLQTAPPSAPSTQPPRPASVGPTATGGGTLRNKYKVDPSVQPAQSYNQYNFNQPQNQTQSYNQTQNQSYNHSYNQSDYNQSAFNPITPAPVVNGASSGGYNGATVGQGGYYAPPEQAVAALPTKPVAPGWNDPPSISRAKPKAEVPTQAPITHPLFGVEPPQHVPLNPTYPGQQYPGQTGQYPGQMGQYPGQTGQYPGQTGQFPGQTGQFQQQQQYQGHQDYPGQQFQQYPQQTASPAPAAEPVAPAPVVKPPLDGDLGHLQASLDGLLAACQARAQHAQVKRKLEDVHKRLETLYDMLRENRLSMVAVTSLQQCVQYAMSCNYESATLVATSLAQGADFAAAASFLPGLKVLFQLSQQLQVSLG